VSLGEVLEGRAGRWDLLEAEVAEEGPSAPGGPPRWALRGGASTGGAARAELVLPASLRAAAAGPRPAAVRLTDLRLVRRPGGAPPWLLPSERLVAVRAANPAPRGAAEEDAARAAAARHVVAGSVSLDSPAAAPAPRVRGRLVWAGEGSLVLAPPPRGPGGGGGGGFSLSVDGGLAGLEALLGEGEEVSLPAHAVPACGERGPGPRVAAVARGGLCEVMAASTSAGPEVAVGDGAGDAPPPPHPLPSVAEFQAAAGAGEGGAAALLGRLWGVRACGAPGAAGAEFEARLSDETGTLGLRLRFAGQWGAGWLCPGNLVLLVGVVAASAEGEGGRPRRAEWDQALGGQLHNLTALPGAAKADALFGLGALPPPGGGGGWGPLLCEAAFAGACGPPSVVLVHRACRRPLTRSLLFLECDEGDGGGAAAAPVAAAGAGTGAAGPTPPKRRDMDGLFECEFCRVECTGSEVARAFEGEADLEGAGGVRQRFRLSSQAWEHLLGVTPGAFAALARPQRAARAARPRGRAFRWMLCPEPPADAGGGGRAPWAALAADPAPPPAPP